MFSLNDKTCVITGGGGDLGRAMAGAFLEAGARVVLVGRRQATLDDAARELGGRGRAVETVQADVSRPDEVHALADALLSRHGAIDVLVTAAGAQHRCPVLDFPADEWDRVLRTNLYGTFYCAQAFGAQMRQRGAGRILMVTSLTAEIGIPNIAAYAASRGGIRQLCKTMAVELAPHGVTVNCIGPGRIETRMTRDLMADTARYERTRQVIPMGRWGKPDDVASTAVFLASDAANYITGQSFYVDGGWLAGGGNLLG